MSALTAVFLGLLLWLQDPAGDTGADAAAGEGALVQEVRLEGSGKVKPETLKAHLRTKVGQPFSVAAANEDMKALFSRFRVLVTEYEVQTLPAGGVRVIFYLQDIGSVRRIEFRGNEELEDEELQQALGLSPSGIYAAGVVGQGQLRGLGRRLQELYEEKGYLYAEINVTMEVVEGENVLFFRILEGPKVKVNEISFRGLSDFKPGHLRDLMGTKESFLFFSRTFRREQLERDLAILEEFLQDEGYLDAHLALEEVVPSDDFSEVDLIIRVQQGLRYQVAGVRLEGLEAFTDQELRPLLRMEPGEPFRQAVFRKDRSDILAYYKNRGYIRASMPTRPRPEFSVSGNQVTLIYEVEEGERKRIRDVRVIGNLNTADEVVRRELYFYPGQVFDQKELNYSQDRLRATGFFNAVDGLPRAWIRHEETDDPRFEDVVVEVEDGPSGFMNFLAGVGSGTGFFVGITIDKDNFDLFDLPTSPWSFFEEFFDQKAFHGGGQRLRLRANPGSTFSNYSAEFEEPFLFGPVEKPISLRVTGYIRDSFFRLYDENRIGGIVTFGKRLTRDSEFRIGPRIERIDISDIQDTTNEVPDLEAAEGKASIRGLVASYFWNNFDFLRNPTEGMRVNVDVEYSGGPFDGLDLFKVNGAVEWLIPVYENEDEQRHIISLRGAVAYATEHGDTDDVPLYERYFAGGTGTLLQIRGFDFRGVGPRQGDEPVGGNGATVINTEYIFPLYEYYEPRIQENVPFLKGVLFVDQGMLESQWEDQADGDWRVSVGLGVRVRIPVQLFSAPLEIYWGVPVHRARQDEREALAINFSTRF